jgi:putative aldouronate transport system permease protein
MTRLKKLKENWELYLLIAPVVAYFIIFQYWPIYGVQIAFKDFSPSLGITGSHWVGLKHFTRFFHSIFFDRVVRNTIGISAYSLLMFPLPIILALMMNEVKNKLFKKAVQNISYAPYFVSQVVLVGMVILFLSPETGVINRVIEFFGGEPKLFMAETAWFKSIFVLSGVWQGLGWGTVIYMAVLAGVDPHLVEAAIVDGASKWQRIRYISVPTLIPTAIVLLILATGNIMNVGFEKVFLLQNPQNLDASDVISTYIYRTGLINSQYSFAAAIGLFNSVINCVILVVVNGIARRYSSNSLW